MMQWKALSAFGDSNLASTCLNFQQGLKRDESSKPKLLSPLDIKGKTKIHHQVMETDVSCDCDNKYFQEVIHLLCLLKHPYT